MNVNIKTLNVDGCDVFLNIYDEKNHITKSDHGKITISSHEHGAFTHYWCSMGCDIKKFLLSLDGHYFAKKLNPKGMGKVFNSGKTYDNVILSINEHFPEFFQSKDIDDQNFLSGVMERLTEIKSMSDEHEFLCFINDLHILDFSEPNDKDLLELLIFIQNEDIYDQIHKDDSSSFYWLRYDFLPKLKEVLKETDI